MAFQTLAPKRKLVERPLTNKLFSISTTNVDQVCFAYRFLTFLFCISVIQNVMYMQMDNIDQALQSDIKKAIRCKYLLRSGQ